MLPIAQAAPDFSYICVSRDGSAEPQTETAVFASVSAAAQKETGLQANEWLASVLKVANGKGGGSALHAVGKVPSGVSEELLAAIRQAAESHK